MLSSLSSTLFLSNIVLKNARLPDTAAGLGAAETLAHRAQHPHGATGAPFGAHQVARLVAAAVGALVEHGADHCRFWLARGCFSLFI